MFQGFLFLWFELFVLLSFINSFLLGQHFKDIKRVQVVERIKELIAYSISINSGYTSKIIVSFKSISFHIVCCHVMVS